MSKQTRSPRPTKADEARAYADLCRTELRLSQDAGPEYRKMLARLADDWDFRAKQLDRMGSDTYTSLF